MRSRNGGFGLLAIVVTAALALACNRGPDPKDQVSQQLKDANLQNVNVDYDRDARVMHLKGAVDSAADRTRAEEIAHKVVGTTGAVANELTVKNVNEHTANDADGTIRSELNAKVKNDRVLSDRDVNFDVNNGVVTIKGEVRNDAEKRQVTDLTKSTENVKEVVNALELNPKLGQNKATRTNRNETSERPQPTTGNARPSRP